MPDDLVGDENPAPARLAALVTCHNRREMTLSCLEALYLQALPPELHLKVLLLDDGSSDGTAESVRELYPAAEIIQGNGSLYWNRGMHLIFGVALSRHYDYCLWLNDDTILLEGALLSLLKTVTEKTAEVTGPVIVAGAAKDPATGMTNYGGLRRTRSHLLHFTVVDPTDDPQPCDTMSGNLVLLTGGAAQALGNLDPHFTHMFGDLDYGLRAVAQGGRIWLAPRHAATCESHVYPWRSSEVGPREMMTQLRSPKGLHFQELWRYARRHAGALAPVLAVTPFVRAAWLALRSQKR